MKNTQHAGVHSHLDDVQGPERAQHAVADAVALVVPDFGTDVRAHSGTHAIAHAATHPTAQPATQPATQPAAHERAFIETHHGPLGAADAR